jgi:hypothetical protein
VKPYYLILTGSKNNAGDFLIKRRAKELFSLLRPDRDIIDLDAWTPLKGPLLEKANASSAIILLGGPALQSHMYPGIYALSPDLSDITAPLTTMGIGWKSLKGTWSSTYTYHLSKDSLNLIKKINSSGLAFSVRDFHSARVLAGKGINNVIMTGCPAYYDTSYFDETPKVPSKIRKVAFSLGVSLVKSRSMWRLMQDQILSLRDKFKEAELEVVFHHSLDRKVYNAAYGVHNAHIERHLQFAKWLDKENISYVDVSGSADAMTAYYYNVDLHVGYRVHAHIFMNSVSKLSLLIAEDGRAKGSESAIGGMVIDGYDDYRTNITDRLAAKLKLPRDNYIPNQNSNRDMVHMLEYELRSGAQKSQSARALINQNFMQMRNYINSLP